MWLLDEATDAAVLGGITDKLSIDDLNSLPIPQAAAACVYAGHQEQAIGNTQIYLRVENPSPDDFVWWNKRIVAFMYDERQSIWIEIEATTCNPNPMAILYKRICQEARQIASFGSARAARHHGWRRSGQLTADSDPVGEDHFSGMWHYIRRVS